MTVPTNPAPAPTMTPPTALTIGEVFAIPRAVHQGDFVLRLTEGVDRQHAEATLRDYVVTPQLQQCFRDALGLVRGALDAGRAAPPTCTAPSAPASRTSWRCSRCC
jgi:hypothetical protein